MFRFSAVSIYQVNVVQA